MVCRCGHEDKLHAFTEPTVCRDIDCKCQNFIPATCERPVIHLSDKYVEQYEKMRDKMKWVLENWRWFRNYTNKDIVIMWWKFVNGYDLYKQTMTNEIYKKLDEPESITRCRR